MHGVLLYIILSWSKSKCFSWNKSKCFLLFVLGLALFVRG